MTSPHAEYERRLALRREALAGLDRRHQRLGYVRLFLLIAGAIVAYAALGREAVSGLWLLPPGVFLVGLGFRMSGLEVQMAKLRRAIAFYERGLARLDGHWAGSGETGARFLDEKHLYAVDLDIFGEASLFELLSGARTRMGEDELASWLTAPAQPDALGPRQQAVTELTQQLDLREDLAVLGEDARVGVHPEALTAWGEREPLLESSAARVAATVLSLLGAVAVAVAAAFVLSWMGFVEIPSDRTGPLSVFLAVIATAVTAVLWRFKQRTDRIIHEVEEALRDLDLLAAVLARLEQQQFSAPRLRELRRELDVEGRPPSQRLARLHLLMDLLDSGNNQLFGLVAPFLLWDLQLAYLFEDWRRSSGPALRRWLDAVGEMEALSSLAGFRYENPEYVFPRFETGPPRLQGEALAHPLLPKQGVVANDVAIGGDLRVLVVSGSNMSGKSTLLRTLGANVVLAQAGAPVRAKSLTLSPLAVCASIRTQDSLQEGVSRFYAEVKRLGAIMETASGTRPVLFLIDELLHGTNSHDRRIGAEAIVRGLAERKAIGLVTTHDLALAHIADTLAPAGRNVHFQDHLEDGQMRFDYKMRPGVVEKSNAIELMRSVGLKI